MVEATAGGAVFGEALAPAFLVAEAMEEASDGGPFIRPGEQGMPRPKGERLLQIERLRQNDCKG